MTTTLNDFNITSRALQFVDNSKTVQELTVTNSMGVAFTCLSYGATITSILAPDRKGKIEEITLCYRGEEYESKLVGHTGPYYGCVVGRCANRIKEGRFTIGEKSFSLAINNGENALHGGIEGFDKKYWEWDVVCTKDKAGFKFTYFSVDGEEGFPGNLRVEVTYLLTSTSKIIMRYTATTDQATVINMTNHTYWNLSGNCRRMILGHSLFLSCSHFLPVDKTQIPTGQIASVIGTKYDFTSLSPQSNAFREAVLTSDGCGQPGLDHCFVVDGHSPAISPEDDLENCTTKPLRHVATLSENESGRVVTLHSTQPGVQIYTANWLAGVHPHVQQ